MASAEFSNNLPLRPWASQRKLSDEAAEYLRQIIIDGTLLPGTRLVEQEVAEQLGISRIPVREAIQQLADEGLLVKEPRKGAYVQPYSEEELEEIYSLRVVLERFVIERVMANWSDTAAHQLQDIVDAMVEAAQREDKKAVSNLDTEFHEMLWTLARHKILLEVVSGLRVRITRFLVKANTTLTADGLSAHAAVHQKLVDLLRDGDVEAAKTEISRHILGAKNRIIHVYQQPEIGHDGTL